MALILKVSTRWSGFPGAPGYTNLYFRDFGTGGANGADPDATQALSAVNRVAAFFDGNKLIFPASLRINVEANVDVHESTTGELVNAISVAAPATISGAGTGGHSGASGAVINWKTAGIRNGRRIRGRSFIVPLAGVCYEPDGTLTSGTVNGLTTTANALAASTNNPDLGVWARPTAPGATDGQWSAVTSASVPDLAAVLRSRR